MRVYTYQLKPFQDTEKGKVTYSHRLRVSSADRNCSALAGAESGRHPISSMLSLTCRMYYSIESVYNAENGVY